MVQYREFKEKFRTTASESTQTAATTLPSWIYTVKGMEELLGLSGSTFNDGIYRIPSSTYMLQLTAMINQLSSRYRNKVFCFGCDWLGRIYAVTSESINTLILMFDPATGEDYEISIDLVDFHNMALVQHDDMLAQAVFAEWYAQSHHKLLAHECVGFAIPLFLGGTDDIASMEVVDIEVCWLLNMQLLSQLNG